MGRETNTLPKSTLPQTALVRVNTKMLAVGKKRMSSNGQRLLIRWLLSHNMPIVMWCVRSVFITTWKSTTKASAKQSIAKNRQSGDLP